MKLGSQRAQVSLRKAAIEFASKIHEEPMDDRDSEGKFRNRRLLNCALSYTIAAVRSGEATPATGGELRAAIAKAEGRS